MLTEQREPFSEQSQHCELHPSKAAESLSLTHPGKVKASSSVRNCKHIKKKRKEMLWWVLMAYLGLVGQHVRLSGLQGPCSRAFSGGDQAGDEQWPSLPQRKCPVGPGDQTSSLPIMSLLLQPLDTTTTLQWLTVLCVSDILLLLLLSLCDLLRYCSFSSSCKNNLTMLMVIFRQT